MRISPFFRVALLLFTLSGALWLGSIASENDAVQGLILSGGYLGVFLFSIINGFNVFVPVVTATFIPALSNAGLDPWVLVLVITVGMSIADAVAFFLAAAGRSHVEGERGRRVARTLQNAEQHRSWLPLVILGFWAAVVPLPTELVIVPIGLLGYPAARVIPIVVCGNFLFNAVVGLGLVDVVTYLF